ncbi:Protein of unknown function [Spirosomataceae bacterium TFI 002]|nr:Protein of unknown function [Spirosomataceae bacterium TFI 002]
MKNNVGSKDKVIRLAIATFIGFLLYSDTISGTLGIIAFVVAVILVATSIFSFCPLYRVFGLSSCPVPKQK